jgi:hypothetical protein
VLWHNEAALWITSSAILRGRQNSRADGHGRHLAELAQGRKQDHLKQTNLSNRITQTDNANPPAEIAADWKTRLLKSWSPKNAITQTSFLAIFLLLFNYHYLTNFTHIGAKISGHQPILSSLQLAGEGYDHISLPPMFLHVDDWMSSETRGIIDVAIMPKVGRAACLFSLSLSLALARRGFEYRSNRHSVEPSF